MATLSLKTKIVVSALVAGALSLVSTAQAQPSFDCSKASTRVENLICDKPRLAELDSELAEAYRTALRDAPWASANRRIRAEQKEWIARRNRCENARCIRKRYIRLIGALHNEVPDSGGDNAAVESNPGTMMAICRNRAAHVFHVRGPNVDTKYEGQRTDGTHAVNGTTYLRGVEETFQCSFDAAGRSIVRFVVN